METESNLSSNQNKENEGTSDHVISIPEEDKKWLASLEEKIKAMPKLLNESAGKSSCCIFRVPQSLVDMNEKAYQPRIVSIGPHHHGKEHLKMIQEHKWRYLGRLLARTKKNGVGLYDLLKVVAPMEEKIRECYSEVIEYGSHEFIEMMVVDGCFIIELFCIVGKIVLLDLHDPLFNMARIVSFLMQDLLRLENQIPFFVLQALFDLPIFDSKKGDNKPSLTKLALEFFNYAAQRPDEVTTRYSNSQGRHLLDLFRLTLVSSRQAVHRNFSPFILLIQPAKKLHLVGIQFRPRLADSFLDVKYSNGVLEIPTLTLDDFSSSLLLNCVAFEGCYNHCSKDITCYVTFMGCLVETPTDAELLRDRNVIENYLGTEEEVAQFFRNISKDVAFDIERSYLSDVFEDVNEYYRHNWHVQWAGFKKSYFETSWPLLSALAAIILLILTLIQAFFPVFGYFRPPQ